jgi:AraC-like DNA-binding protein
MLASTCGDVQRMARERSDVKPDSQASVNPVPAGRREADLPAAAGGEAEQRVGVFVALAGLLQEFQLDPGPLLVAHGLVHESLADADARVPYAAVGSLLATCAERTGCDHFGLLLGQRASLSYLGILAEIARNSPTVGEALRTFSVNQHLYSGGGAVYLFQDADEITFGYAIYHAGLRGFEQIHDMAMAQMLGGVRELCGGLFQPRVIELSRHAPADAAPYRRAFPVPVVFDSVNNAMRFSADVMQRPIAGADPARLRELIAMLEAAGRHNLLNRLRRTLRIQLLRGDTTGDHAAQMLDLHRRTLNRRLMRRGTTFQNVLDQVRFDAARHLLHLTRIPVPRIASSLGYSNASSFTRAFRRWSGDTPARYRAVPAAGAGPSVAGRA